jgi:MOSC domain-containing protein YiiM
VLCYAAAHYSHWQAELGRPDISWGGFGENITIEGPTEETACLGDHYTIGDARVEVTDPRFPCWKIERRWRTPGLTARVRDTGRTGWFCGVLHEGSVAAGMPVFLIARPYPEWTLARVNDVIHNRQPDHAVVEALIACPGLNPWWVPILQKRLDG